MHQQMLSLVTGLCVGVVMGLTGAGGALISLFFFMTFWPLSLKEASFYSLGIVILSSLFHCLPNRKLAHFKLALGLVALGFFGSMGTAIFKERLSVIWGQGALVAVALFSLAALWSTRVQEILSLMAPLSPFKFIVLGLFLGVLTTLTGIGGGVLMVPVFVGVLGLSLSEATATSLVTAGLTSLFSFAIQGSMRGFQLPPFAMAPMILGVFISTLVIHYGQKKLKEENLKIIKKSLFTLVVLITLARVIILGS